MHSFKPLSVIAQDANPAMERAKTVVYGLYRGFLGRDPEPGGLQHWTGKILSGADSSAVLKAILASEEYRQQVKTLETSATAPAHQTAFREHLCARASSLMAARPLTIVDVGAQELESEQHVYAPLCKTEVPFNIIGFEPLRERIEERRAKNPDSRIKLYPTFIGDGGVHIFHVNSPDATSSLLPLNPILNGQLQDLSPLFTERTETVPTSTLDEVLHETAHIDFLKLDIQGFELPALQHAAKVLARTNVVHCEVSFAEMYEGQALFSEIEPLLRAQGFYFLDFSFQCHYPYHCRSGGNSRDRLVWADAVFFKEPPLCSGADLLAQALIASLIYDKDTLADVLMERHEEATRHPRH